MQKVTPLAAQEGGDRSPLLRIAALIIASGLGLWGFFWVLARVLAVLPEPIGSRAALLNEGAQTTMLLTLGAGGMGLVLGVVLGLAKVARFPLARWPAETVIFAVRGTPLLVQILFVYFALPAIVPWLKLNEFMAGMLALALNVGAYNAEVIRAGIEAIPRGQTEASRSLGLSHAQTMIHVVLPQAIRIVVPPLVNNVIALLKDSSLVSTIGLLELALAGSRISSETFQPVPVLTTVAAIYLILTTVLNLMTSALDWNLRRGRAAR